MRSQIAAMIDASNGFPSWQSNVFEATFIAIGFNAIAQGQSGIHASPKQISEYKSAVKAALREIGRDRKTVDRNVNAACSLAEVVSTLVDGPVALDISGRLVQARIATARLEQYGIKTVSRIGQLSEIRSLVTQLRAAEADRGEAQ